MNKKNQYGWILLMVLCIFLPYPLYFVLSPVLDTNNYEKRELAKLPTINSLKDLKDAPGQIDDYVNDHMAFRNQLIRTVNYSNYKLFGISSSKKVIVGKDDWLFYDSAANNDKIGRYKADTVADYQGTNLYTEDELMEIANNVQSNSDRLQEVGIEFVIFIAPNKEHVYDEYFPDKYGKVATNTRVDQLVDYLKNNSNVKVVYPYEELMQYKNDYNLYYHLDTHWNNLGAYIGTKKLMKAINTSLPEIHAINIKEINNSGLDLSDMMNTRTLLKDDVDYDLDYNVLQKNEGKILFLHDSFGIAMEDHIKNATKEFVSINSWEYNDKMLISEKPTIVVYETVERYLDGLRDLKLIYED